jgi:hypothetical protein
MRRGKSTSRTIFAVGENSVRQDKLTFFFGEGGQGGRGRKWVPRQLYSRLLIFFILVSFSGVLCMVSSCLPLVRIPAGCTN